MPRPASSASRTCPPCPTATRSPAKFPRPSGRGWKVMDAESKNGVRVNGEPYAAIGLKHGDIVEIGHLRFAFALPGQPFSLPKEMAGLAPGVGPVQQGGKGLAIGLGIALVAVL